MSLPKEVTTHFNIITEGEQEIRLRISPIALTDLTPRDIAQLLDAIAASLRALPYADVSMETIRGGELRKLSPAAK